MSGESFLSRRGLKRRLAPLGEWVLGALALAGALLGVASIWVSPVPPIPWVGNRSETLARMPACSSTGEFRFAVLGDSEDGLPVLEQLLGKIRDRSPAFILMTGDIVRRGARSRYEQFIGLLNRMNWAIPIVCAVGNSDVSVSGPALFEEFLGPRTFHFEYGGCLFAMVDNSQGHLSPDGVRQLDRLLTETRNRYRRVFLAMHRPLIPYTHWPDGVAKVQNQTGCEDVLELVRRHRVDVVLAGHLHAYAREVVDGTLHVITGGGGGRLQTPDAQYHFVEMSVGTDGALADTMIQVGHDRSAVAKLWSDWHTKLRPYASEHPLRYACLEAAAVFAFLACLAAARPAAADAGTSSAPRDRRLAALAMVGFALAVAGVSITAPSRVRGDPVAPDESPAVSESAEGVRVRVAVAEQGALPLRVRVLARTTSPADGLAGVCAPLAGRVAEVAVREGQTVAAGQVVARLDQAPFQELLARAEAAVRMAELERARAVDSGFLGTQEDLELAVGQTSAADRAAREELARVTGLRADSLASEKCCLDARRAAEMASQAASVAAEKLRRFRDSEIGNERARLDAGVEAARLDVLSARRQLEWVTLRAPCSGRISAPPAAVGQWVDAGGLVASLVAGCDLVLAAELTPADAARVTVGAAADFDPGTGPVRPGRIRRVAATADPGTSLIPIEATMPAGDPPFLPTGVSGYLEIDLGSAQEGILLPASAICAGEDGATIMWVDEQLHAHAVPVRVTARSGDRVVVLGDIPAGASVVIEGAFNLPDDTLVKIEAPR